MAKDRTLPDSPPWVFSNPSNVAAASGSLFAYTAANKVNVLDVETGENRFVLESDNLKAKVMWVALEGETLAYSLANGSVFILGIHGKDVFNQGKLQIRNDSIESLAFLSPDCLAIGCKSGKLHLAHGSTIDRTIACTAESVTKLQVHDGFCVFGNRCLYELESPTAEARLLYSHKRPVAAVSLVTNTIGDLCVAVVDLTGTLVVLEKDKVTRTEKVPEGGRVNALAWISADTLVCGSPDGQLHIYHFSTEVSSHIFVNNLHTKSILALLPLSSRLISIGMDRRLTLWNITETESSSRTANPAQRFYAEPVWSFVTLGASVLGLGSTSEGTALVAYGEPHIIVWSPDFGKQMSVSMDNVSEEGITGIAVSPHVKSLIAVTTEKSAVAVYDTETETVKGTTRLIDVRKVVWKSDNEVFILTPRALSSFTFTTGQLTSTYALTEDCCTFCICGDHCWFGSLRGNVLAFSSPTTRFYASTLHTGQIHALLSNGSLVAAASEDSVVSLHSSTGKYVASLSKHYRPVLTLAWHPSDTALLASGSIDHSIQIWNVRTLTAIVNLRGHLGAVRHIVWTKDDILLTGSDDQTVKVWDLRKPRADCEPPVLQVSRKNDTSKVKSLFAKLHPLVYQQNRNEAVAACKRLALDPQEETSEQMLFNLDREKALKLIAESKKLHDSIVLTFWQRLRPYTPSTVGLDQDVGVIDPSWIDISPLLGPEVWMHLCLSRAHESLLDRNLHKSALYFIAAGEPQSACSLYTSSNLYLDALILAAVLQLDLPPIYEQWAERLTSTGLHEQAFKCHLGSRDYLKALEAIGRSTSKDTVSLEQLHTAVSRLV